jgi:hypothetical protein
VYPQVLDPDTGQRVSAGETWRGGGFRDTPATRAFFTVYQKYRVPHFLASSARKAVTNTFMQRAEDLGYPVVQWRFVFDGRGDPRGNDNAQEHRCKHVNQLRETHVAGEVEYLFQAYSAFTVREVQWSDVTPATKARPHRIMLTPAVDNARELEDLPLAPWS